MLEATLQPRTSVRLFQWLRRVVRGSRAPDTPPDVQDLVTALDSLGGDPAATARSSSSYRDTPSASSSPTNGESDGATAARAALRAARAAGATEPPQG